MRAIVFKIRRCYLLFLAFLPSILLAGPFDYWQQKVDYKINVSLDDENHFLRGDITIEYTNNSPSSLEYIYMHLWPNAYKNLNTAYAIQKRENGNLRFYDSDMADRGYIDSINFRVDNANAKYELDPKNIDIVKLILNKPLESGKKCVIRTPFMVKLPKTFSRMGHVGQDYQISQWFPKPAVYDQKGWHQMPYLDQGEFYSEYGSFDVSIDLPSNYIVGATGVLQNEDEVEWLNKEAEATEGLLDKGVQYNDKFLNRTGRKTLRYLQENIHDFAWFASKNYKVRKKVAELESGKKVTVWAMFYKEDLSVWRQATDYASDALVKYSKWIGDYPYDNCTVVEGPLEAGGGMEYPMITIITSKILKPESLDGVITHEVGHNWFYGILGSNERAHPWLDEGLNSFYERRYMMEKYGHDMDMPKQISKYFDAEEMDLRSLAYLIQVNRLKAQAIGLHSEKFSEANYGVMVYMTTPLMLEGLQAYLGREEFDELMQKYFSTWKFKHPQPESLEGVFESSGKNLDWFFNDIIQTTDNINYKLVKKLKKEKSIGGISYATLRVKNKGFVGSPFTVSGIKGDSIIKTTWYDGFNGELDLLFMDGEYDRYEIDAQKHFPDVNRRNNILKTKGIFKNVPRLRFQPGLTLRNKGKAEILYMPALLWNNYDKLMLGASIYNGFLFKETVEYGITPLYALGSKQLVGSARFGFNFTALSSLSIKNVNINFSATRFSHSDHEHLGNLNYNRLISTSRFNFREKDLREKKRSYIELRTGIMSKEYAKKYITYYEKEDLWEKKDINYNLFDLHYVVEQNQVLKNYKLDLKLEAGEGLLKTNLTYNTHLRFSKKTGMDLRLFAGGFLYNDNQTAVDYRYRISGYQGKNDYWFDDMYLGRSESKGILSQQLYMNDGGFKVFSPVGQTDKWLVSANIEMKPPWNLPIKVYGDIGTYHNAGYLVQGQTDWIVYDFGLTLKLPFMSVYWPMIMSPDIKKAVELNNSTYLQRISFFFNLSGLNPYKLRHKVDL